MLLQTFIISLASGAQTNRLRTPSSEELVAGVVESLVIVPHVNPQEHWLLIGLHSDVTETNGEENAIKASSSTPRCFVRQG